ncbi:MAG: glycoside hydrolase family 99-like domain-containing protein [bacterium]
MKVIAFYLPQFHPIPENDEWWGKGFTEWRNVTRAKPLFPGHDQPRLPADLGFYDLRVPEVQIEQAEMAKKFGIHGFCYYYYWFDGKKLLDRPLTQMLENPKVDLPFCLCYANENWTRRWDGKEQEILMEQKHSRENDEKFIRDLLPIFKDPRYIKVGNKPVLIIYRALLFPDILQTTRLWRKIAQEAGFEDLYLCKCQVFGDTSAPDAHGFDACVEFPPFGTSADVVNTNMAKKHNHDFNGNICSYQDIARVEKSSQRLDFPLHKTVMLNWDNTARKGNNATIFSDFSLGLYESWLGNAVWHTAQNFSDEKQLVFVNAWNEWAEGTYLEPDKKHGFGCLDATKRALDAHQFASRYSEMVPKEKREVFRAFIQHRDINEKVLLDCVGLSGAKVVTLTADKSELENQVRSEKERRERETFILEVENRRIESELRELKGRLTSGRILTGLFARKIADVIMPVGTIRRSIAKRLYRMIR